MATRHESAHYTTRPTDRPLLLAALAVAHPDRNDGDNELFVFLTALQEHILECATVELSCRHDNVAPAPQPERGFTKDQDRVPYDAALGAEDEFYLLTHRALSIGQTLEEPLRSLLLILLDYCPTDHGRRADKQGRGATYKQLAYIAHLVPCNKAERTRWYEICRTIPLAEAHAAHIINELKKHQAAA